jgi:hypothetical protein
MWQPRACSRDLERGGRKSLANFERRLGFPNLPSSTMVERLAVLRKTTLEGC